MTDLKTDPDFEEALYPLNPEELMSLTESIKSEGCRDPIVTWNGTIVDGHNRYRICKANNIPFQTINKDFEDRDSAMAWILGNQLARRNLTPFQRTEINIKRSHIWEKRAKAKQVDEGKNLGGNPTLSQKSAKGSIDTREEIAKASHVSHDTVSKVEKILEHGKPEEIEKARKGETSIHAAYKKVDKRVKNEKRKKEDEKKIEELPDYSDRYNLICKSIEELDAKTIASDSIDVVITDPPYSKKSVNLFEDLSKLAKRVLKPGGSLIVMTGQSYLPEILQLISKEMRYQWMLAYLTPGGQAVQLWDRKVNTFWKPLLWFVKGEYRGEWIGDVTKSKPNDNDKRFHDWGQSESGMRDIIERFTRPGMRVLDPFLGGGTTGIVAIRANTFFIGVDVDKQCIENSDKRIRATIGAMK